MIGCQGRRKQYVFFGMHPLRYSLDREAEQVALACCRFNDIAARWRYDPGGRLEMRYPEPRPRMGSRRAERGFRGPGLAVACSCRRSGRFPGS